MLTSFVSETDTALNRRGWGRAAGLLALAAWPWVGLAQEPGGSATPAASETVTVEDLLNMEDLLNTMVVTASGEEEERALASANVVSMSRDEIARRGHRSLGEVLADVAGLYVVEDLVQPSVGVRGVTPGFGGGTRIVRVMINGVPVNFQPTLSAFLGPEYIPLEAVERVEVAKGPLSALHGANAFLATVNVITRTPPEGSHGEVAGRLVSPRFNEGYGGSALVTARYGPLELLAAFTAESVDRSGLQAQSTFPAQDAEPVRYAFLADRSARDRSSPLGLYVNLKGESETFGTLTVEGGFQRLDAAGEFQLNSVLTHASRVVLQNAWSNVRYARDFGPHFKLSASFGYARGTPTGEYKLELTGARALAFQPRFDYSAVSGTVEGAWTPTSWFRAKLGVDGVTSQQTVLYYRVTFQAGTGMRSIGETLDLIDPAAPRHRTVNDLGVYLQVSTEPLRALPDLHFTANVRLDSIAYGDLTFPLQLSLRGAAAYRWNKAVVSKVVFGRAFQTPSAVLMFANPGFGNSNNVIGNLERVGAAPLRPQTADSVEAMLSANLFDTLALEGSVFFQSIGSPISFVRSGLDFFAVNGNPLQVVGAELSARARLGHFEPFADASLAQHLTLQPGVAAPSYPFLWGLIGLHADWQKAHLRGTATLRYVGARGATQGNQLLNNDRAYSLPAYPRLDLSVSTLGWDFFGPGTDTRLSLAVRNVLGQVYAEPGFGGFDPPTVGRTFFLELRQVL